MCRIRRSPDRQKRPNDRRSKSQVRTANSDERSVVTGQQPAVSRQVTTNNSSLITRIRWNQPAPHFESCSGYGSPLRTGIPTVTIGFLLVTVSSVSPHPSTGHVCRLRITSNCSLLSLGSWFSALNTQLYTFYVYPSSESGVGSVRLRRNSPDRRTAPPSIDRAPDPRTNRPGRHRAAIQTRAQLTIAVGAPRTRISLADHRNLTIACANERGLSPSLCWFAPQPPYRPDSRISSR